MNNHRYRLKQLGNFYLYNHFNSDGHSLDDISIMPIEAVFYSPEDTTTIGSKLLSCEEFWYKELGSIYPYGLNDNVKQLGNVSQKIERGLVMYSLFNKHECKFHNRLKPRNKVKVGGCWKQDFVNLLNNYKCLNFCHKLRTTVFCIHYQNAY